MIQVINTNRGLVTEEVNKIFNKYLKRDATIKDLRSLVFIEYNSRNTLNYNNRKYTEADYEFMDELMKNNLIQVFDGNIYVTKDFINFASEVMWESYVPNKLI